MRINKWTCSISSTRMHGMAERLYGCGRQANTGTVADLYQQLGLRQRINTASAALLRIIGADGWSYTPQRFSGEVLNHEQIRSYAATAADQSASRTPAELLKELQQSTNKVSIQTRQQRKGISCFMRPLTRVQRRKGGRSA